jgi:mannose-6-phosphate isomerase-like protein (cupin superfamily)
VKLPEQPDAVAPDGSAVRILEATSRGSMAHFELPVGATSLAVRHRTVEELWFFLSGRGEMWRASAGVVEVGPGVSLAIPVGVAFQFRALGDEPLRAVGTTMPPWPGDDEAEIVDGPWQPYRARA